MAIKLINNFLAIAVLTLISGCTANGLKYTKPSINPDNTESFIIVYREKNFIASSACYTVKIDKKPIRRLANGGFLKLKTAPGNHLISLKAKNVELPVEAINGKIKYIELSITTSRDPSISAWSNQITVYQYKLTEMDEKTAEETLHKLKDSSEENRCLTNF